MKSLYKPFLAIVALISISLNSYATFWTVEVKNNVFNNSPAVVAVGDIIHWQWLEGTHTTTSTMVPSGADTWNYPITSTNTTYDYYVAVAGSYSYMCTVHGTTMSADFTALTTAISPTPFANAFEVTMNDNNVMTLSYYVQSPARINIGLYDLTGKLTKQFASADVTPGLFKHELPVTGIAPGMYFVVLQTGNKRNTQRIIIH